MKQIKSVKTTDYFHRAYAAMGRLVSNGTTKNCADSIKSAARQELFFAVKYGFLDRPSRCEKCGRKSNIHGHHDDYGAPLDVTWLCARCHAKWHRECEPVVRAFDPYDLWVELDEILLRNEETAIGGEA